MPRKRGGANGGGASEPSRQGLMTSPSVKSKVKLTSNNARKKKQKWAPFDLTTINSSSEADDASAFQIDESSEPVPPTETTSFIQATGVAASSLTSAPLRPIVPVSQPHHHRNEHSVSIIHGQKGGTLMLERVDSFNRTPTQATYGRYSDLNLSSPPLDAERHTILHKEDTVSTKNKLKDIMSRINGAFDVEEWDPDLPSGDVNNLPEPLTIDPQPVAYTTVGSLVKSNATPQFAPPVRMQREGASRRPPPGVSQPRGLENTFGMRGTATQSGTGLRSSYGLPNHNVLNQLPRIMPPLADVEKDVLLRQLGMEATVPAMQCANMPGICNNVTQIYPLDNDPGRSTENVGYFQEGGAGLSQSAQSSLSDLNKMQTLQRLSQYPNPMQQSAKKRLSAFALAKTQNMNNSTDPSLAFLRDISHNNESGKNTILETEVESENLRHLNFGFSLPEADGNEVLNTNLGFPSDHNPQRFEGSAIKRNDPQIKTVPRGYPRPLTAGPPGHRLAAIGTKKPQPIFPHEFPVPSHGQSDTSKNRDNQQHVWPPANYPWAPSTFNPNPRPFTSVPMQDKKIRNTVPLSEVEKYYPYGLPADMVSDYSYRSPGKVDKDTGVIGYERLTQEERIQKQNDWFHVGVRKVRKTIDEHVNDLSIREEERSHGPTTTLRTPPAPLIAEDALTIERINNMSEAEVAASLLDASFGTLLSYADEHFGDPTNKSVMSKFNTPPSWCIDDSEKGRKSFFGDDCGPTPKRLGRDPRYQTNPDGGRWS